MTVNDKTLQNVYIIDNNGVKRRIKRVYIGVNGNAKKIADTILTVDRHYKTATPLSQARYYLAATSIGDYALFGGGVYDVYNGITTVYYFYSVVDAYDTSLVRTTPVPLSKARQALSATSIGNYALFGGGYDSYSPSDVVDAYSVKNILI